MGKMKMMMMMMGMMMIVMMTSIDQYHHSVSSSHCQPSDKKFRQYHQVYVKKALKSVKRTKNPRIHRPTDRPKDLKDSWRTCSSIVISFCPSKSPDEIFRLSKLNFLLKKR